MNNLKYKLYNDEDNRMEVVTSMKKTAMGWLCDSISDDMDESEWNCVQPVVQFTGFISESKCEIYHKDILRVTEYIDGNYLENISTDYRVEWNKFGWCLQPMDRDLTHPQGMYLSGNETWEVVGNTFMGIIDE